MAAATAAMAAVTTVMVVILPPQGRQSLLLRVGVDVRADDEGDDVEEGDPHLLGQELLREGEGDRRRDPRDLHDGPEAGADSGPDLVKSLRAGDDGHRDEVDGVLDRRDLGCECK